MTAVPHDAVAGPAKEPAPPLNARAPRPKAIRLRHSAVRLAVFGAVGLVASALAYAFILDPAHRAAAAHKRPPQAASSPANVRAAEAITSQPASYDRLATAAPILPAPRLGGDLAPAIPAKPDPAKTAPPAAVAGVQSAAPVSAVAQARTAAREQAQQAAGSGLFFDGGRFQAVAAQASTSEAAVAAPQRQDYASVYSGHALLAPLSPYEVKAGSFIPGALITAVDTSRQGPVLAAVTQNVYDTVSGRILLVPQGSKLIGRYGGDSHYGDKRAFLVWDRLILPNGKSLVLGEEPGVDGTGATGLHGRADRRLLQLGVAVLIGAAVTTLGEVARNNTGSEHSLIGNAGDAASIEGAQVGGRLLDRELDVRPSIRVRAGAPVRVLVTRDLILEPYRP